MEIYSPLLGIHTIAVVRVKVEQDSLRVLLANAIRDVNAMVEDAHTMVDGHHMNLQFYLSEDYKVNYIPLIQWAQYFTVKSASHNNIFLFENVSMY